MAASKRKLADEGSEAEAQETASSSDEQTKKTVKKSKTEKKPKVDQEDDEEGEGTGVASGSGAHLDDDVPVHTTADGEKYIALGKLKRATARDFKGRVLLDIREFYADKAGEEKPGKKGISLTPEQWEELKKAAPTIDALLKHVPKAVEKKKAKK